jgi:hypothetical protein
MNYKLEKVKRALATPAQCSTRSSPSTSGRGARGRRSQAECHE